MFSFFTKPKGQPLDLRRPSPTALPPRQPCKYPCSDQSDSIFFANIPAEIRNLIYEYVFTFPSSEWKTYPDLTPDPLCLLLTCQKVNQEATNLAYHHFPFSIRAKTVTLDNLRIKTSHLSTQQHSLITCISHTPGCLTPTLGEELLLSNAIVHFPGLKRFEVNLPNDPDPFHWRGFTPQLDLTKVNYTQLPVEDYLPSWYKFTVLAAVNELASIHHRTWHIHCPQLDHLNCTSSKGKEKSTNFSPAPQSHHDTVDISQGLSACPCGCDIIIWSSINLHEATGRSVTVNLTFHGKPKPNIDLDALDPELRIRRRYGGNAIILRPGAPALPVIEGSGRGEGTTSYAYEADEEFWEERKRRNGDVGAMVRYWWKNGVGLGGSGSDKLPGSRALGQGDWPRMREGLEIEGGHALDPRKINVNAAWERLSE